MTRLILCDENKVLKEEQKRLRLLRINQTRAASKVSCANVRESFREKKDELVNKRKAELEAIQRCKINKQIEKYEGAVLRSIENFGKANRDAIEYNKRIEEDKRFSPDSNNESIDEIERLMAQKYGNVLKRVRSEPSLLAIHSNPCPNQPKATDVSRLIAGVFGQQPDPELDLTVMPNDPPQREPKNMFKPLKVDTLLSSGKRRTGLISPFDSTGISPLSSTAALSTNYSPPLSSGSSTSSGIESDGSSLSSVSSSFFNSQYHGINYARRIYDSLQSNQLSFTKSSLFDLTETRNQPSESRQLTRSGTFHGSTCGNSEHQLTTLWHELSQHSDTDESKITTAHSTRVNSESSGLATSPNVMYELEPSTSSSFSQSSMSALSQHPIDDDEPHVLIQYHGTKARQNSSGSSVSDKGYNSLKSSANISDQPRPMAAAFKRCNSSHLEMSSRVVVEEKVNPTGDPDSSKIKKRKIHRSNSSGSILTSSNKSHDSERMIELSQDSSTRSMNDLASSRSSISPSLLGSSYLDTHQTPIAQRALTRGMAMLAMIDESSEEANLQLSKKKVKSSFSLSTTSSVRLSTTTTTMSTTTTTTTSNDSLSQTQLQRRQLSFQFANISPISATGSSYSSWQTQESTVANLNDIKSFSVLMQHTLSEEEESSRSRGPATYLAIQ